MTVPDAVASAPVPPGTISRGRPAAGHPTRSWAALLAAVLLAACATSPAPRYFRLAAVAPPATAAPVATGGAGLVVGPFQFAEYLDRPQLVTRDGANGVVIDDYARWAEPLDASFQAVLAADLAARLGSDRVLEFPGQTLAQSAPRLTGRVLRFDVDAAGTAVLEVQWGLLGPDGSPRLAGRVSRHTATAAGRDPAARVAALNATVTAFAAELAAAVATAP